MHHDGLGALEEAMGKLAADAEWEALEAEGWAFENMGVGFDITP